MSSGRSRFLQQHALDGCCAGLRATHRMIIAREAIAEAEAFGAGKETHGDTAHICVGRIRGGSRGRTASCSSQRCLRRQSRGCCCAYAFIPSPARTRSNMFSGRQFIKFLPLNLKRKRHGRWPRTTQLGRKPRIPGSRSVLQRLPPPRRGRGRFSELLSELDTELRG